MRYEYFCDAKHHNGCGHVFEVDLTIEERMTPMNEPCPECGKKDTICRSYTSHTFHGVVNPKDKMSEDFKETMTRIHKEHDIKNSEYF